MLLDRNSLDLLLPRCSEHDPPAIRERAASWSLPLVMFRGCIPRFAFGHVT